MITLKFHIISDIENNMLCVYQLAVAVSTVCCPKT